MHTIAFILTSVSRIDGTGQPSGSWLEELAVPYYILKDAGHQVRFVSIAGGAAPLDPASTSGDFCTDTGRRLLADADAMRALGSTVALADFDSKQVDAVYFVGGTAVMWDFPSHVGLARLLEQMTGAHKPIGAVCHGVAALLNGPAGKPIVAGRRITVISDLEDQMFGADKIVPFLPESAFRKHGAHVTVAEPFTEHVVEDGLFVTGQNPASAGEVGRRLIALLSRVPASRS